MYRLYILYHRLCILYHRTEHILYHRTYYTREQNMYHIPQNRTYMISQTVLIIPQDRTYYTIDCAYYTTEQIIPQDRYHRSTEHIIPENRTYIIPGTEHILYHRLCILYHRTDYTTGQIPQVHRTYYTREQNIYYTTHRTEHIIIQD